jgi:hypothetical protein
MAGTRIGCLTVTQGKACRSSPGVLRGRAGGYRGFHATAAKDSPWLGWEKAAKRVAVVSTNC